MKFKLTLSNIQHLKKLTFSADLSKNLPMCIVGKNGVGKTTLIRAIMNLGSTDTFTKTASPYIFNKNSRIHYEIDGKEYNFQYNSKLKIIDTKEIIDKDIKDNISVELPIPHGERFHHFQTLGGIDDKLRKHISLQEYSVPDELIKFLSNVYSTNRFDSLKEVSIRGKKYYFILKDNDFYIREDYLSSGEYFVINLYKMIQRKCKLIVIDEIDISLDASAQVNLLKELRTFCTKYKVNIIFTTHSLALMRKLEEPELYYMDEKDSIVTLKNKSYSYVKSILFGFKGWDKYILTEDKVLKNYLTHLLSSGAEPIFFQYKIIYIGGGNNVVDLMKRNESEEFFSLPDNVISVLDGDQMNEPYCQNKGNVFFIPFESVEKQLKEHYDNGDISDQVNNSERPKGLFNSLIQENKMSEIGIFNFINESKKAEVESFKSQLLIFLNKKS